MAPKILVAVYYHGRQLAQALGFLLTLVLLIGLAVVTVINAYLLFITMLEHIGRLARMSVLDTEVDGSNPGSSMLFP